MGRRAGGVHHLHRGRGGDAADGRRHRGRGRLRCLGRVRARAHERRLGGARPGDQVGAARRVEDDGEGVDEEAQHTPLQDQLDRPGARGQGDRGLRQVVRPSRLVRAHALQPGQDSVEVLGGGAGRVQAQCRRGGRQRRQGAAHCACVVQPARGRLRPRLPARGRRRPDEQPRHRRSHDVLRRYAARTLRHQVARRRWRRQEGGGEAQGRRGGGGPRADGGRQGGAAGRGGGGRTLTTHRAGRLAKRVDDA
mmetsp:Transcript_23956/g.80915  ORF Transcript_23956/g.80915 Transcript_23956/m.80915 type:complete len:251 (-) Transcript_23956:550-1302(-)